jgi:hypothetical protein
MAVVAHAFSGYGEGEMPRSKAELEIMQLAGSIRDKPLWWNKVRDPSITNRWQAESLNGVNDSEADCEYRTRQFLFALGNASGRRCNIRDQVVQRRSIEPFRVMAMMNPSSGPSCCLKSISYDRYQRLGRTRKIVIRELLRWWT